MDKPSPAKRMIPISLPLLGEEEQAAAARPIGSGWVTQGPEVAAFEKEFAEYAGAAHACAVSNCTTALHLALKAAGVGHGDEVITVSHSFIATANSIRYCGALPVFVDINPRTFNIDPERVEEAITERTKAVLAVHQIGMPCDLSALLPIARRHGLALIEDAACAIGSEILWEGQWEKVGKPHGDAACFSFHPRKVITTGDGGMITTRHAQWDQQFRLWRQHCMSVPDTARHHSDRVIVEHYTGLGYNYRLTDIQAAVGREQLKRLPSMIVRRRELAERYVKLLSDIEGLVLPHEPAWARSTWQSYCLGLPEQASQIPVMQALKDLGVATKTGIMCAHREPAYVSFPLCHPLPESERAQDRSLLIPLFTQMTEDDQDYVVDCLHKILNATA